MIISTSKSDTMLKRCFGRDKAVIIAIDKMLDQFVIDPTSTNPVRDVYVVTNEDISAKRIKDKFEQVLLTKHPATKVILINKSSKAIYPNGLAGLDAILQKPKPNDIVQAVSAVIAASSVSDVVEKQLNTNIEIPDYNPDEINPIDYQPEPEEIVQETEPEPLPEPDFNIDFEPEPEPEPEQKSSIVERIERAGTVADVSSVMRELTATALIRDLYETNSTYAGIEEKLKSIENIIMDIINDNNTRSLEEKLSKIRAIAHDKTYYRANGDTIIEQRLTEIIDVLCSRVTECLHSRLAEIDAGIRKSYTEKDIELKSARLAGINEERANILTELHTLEQEIVDIDTGVTNLITDLSTELVKNSTEVTPSPIYNSKLEQQGAIVLSDQTLDVIRTAMSYGTDKVPETFKSLRLEIVTLLMTVRKLFELDQEEIAAQQMQINFLKANQIEDTVVAQTLLKKSLRVYVAHEGTGRTIVPYLLSKYKSRQNANVLLLDLTGTGKYSDYGVLYTSVDDYFSNLQQREFMLAVGRVDNSVETAQRIMSTLLKAADYYRVINVVIAPEQQDLFRTLAQDVLSINFITDSTPRHLDEMRDVISHCTVPNVARRVIINKCETPIRSIISKLGLDDEIDFQVATIPTVPAITDAALNKYDPYGVSAVDIVMEEVLKHA